MGQGVLEVNTCFVRTERVAVFGGFDGKFYLRNSDLKWLVIVLFEPFGFSVYGAIYFVCLAWC